MAQIPVPVPISRILCVAVSAATWRARHSPDAGQPTWGSSPMGAMVSCSSMSMHENWCLPESRRLARDWVG